MLQAERSVEVSKRMSALREKVISMKPSVCTERAMFYTQVYAENAGRVDRLDVAAATQRAANHSGTRLCGEV